MLSLNKNYRVIALPLFQNNYSYIIQGTAKNSLVLVDPANPPIILNYLQNNFPKHIVSHVLYTHKHWDHAGGSEELRSQLQKINPAIQVVIGLHDKQFVKGANIYLDPNQEIIIGKSIVRTIHVPRHTRGHTIYSFLPLHQDQKEGEQNIIASQKTLQGKTVYKFDSDSCTFTGDTLFVAGMGRFSQGSTLQISINIENMIKLIDENSDIFCGHEFALANLEWAVQVQKQNEKMREYYNQLKKEYKQTGTVRSIPSSLKKQKEINLFVRAVTGTPLHQKIHKNPAELLQILRDMKNSNLTS